MFIYIVVHISVQYFVSLYLGITQAAQFALCLWCRLFKDRLKITGNSTLKTQVFFRAPHSRVPVVRAFQSCTQSFI
jgi:hypothetical protein